MEKFKIQVKSLSGENKKLQKESVEQQARAEQEEEFISNTLLKKIQELKKEKVRKRTIFSFHIFFIEHVFCPSNLKWKQKKCIA